MSNLPPKGTEEREQIKRRYAKATIEERVKMALELGYRNPDGLRRTMAHDGITAKSMPQETLQDSEPQIIPIPQLKIKPLPQEGKRGEGEEVMLALISDSHIGLRTPTYNTDTFKSRLETLYKTIIKLCLLHRKMRPIKKLVIVFLGDIVNGQQIGVQGRAEEYELPGAEQQIYEYAVPEFSNFIISLLQIFPIIEWYGVEGNHGNINRRNSTITKRSNWDTVFYRTLNTRLQEYKNIIGKPETETWWQVINVNGWDFLAVHGDQINSYQGLPFYGIERRAQRWKQTMPHFHYLLCGHFHNPNILWNNEIETFVNGAMISDSDFPLVRMGLRDVPRQLVLFVNAKFGITARYSVCLD